jgi:hypothetical protein
MSECVDMTAAKVVVQPFGVNAASRTSPLQSHTLIVADEHVFDSAMR